MFHQIPDLFEWLFGLMAYIPTHHMRIEDKDNNVEFITAVWARKLRVVCRTTRAVEFGEELLTKYGDTYWDDVRGEKW